MSCVHVWTESGICRGNCKCESWGRNRSSVLEEEKGEWARAEGARLKSGSKQVGELRRASCTAVRSRGCIISKTGRYGAWEWHNPFSFLSSLTEHLPYATHSAQLSSWTAHRLAPRHAPPALAYLHSWNKPQTFHAFAHALHCFLCSCQDSAKTVSFWWSPIFLGSHGATFCLCHSSYNWLWAHQFLPPDQKSAARLIFV